jgi:hypothetical protein
MRRVPTPASVAGVGVFQLVTRNLKLAVGSGAALFDSQQQHGFHHELEGVDLFNRAIDASLYLLGANEPVIFIVCLSEL